MIDVDFHPKNKKYYQLNSINLVHDNNEFNSAVAKTFVYFEFFSLSSLLILLCLLLPISLFDLSIFEDNFDAVPTLETN